LPDDHDVDFGTPCPVPAGGSHALEPARARAADRERASLWPRSCPTTSTRGLTTVGIRLATRRPGW
jgi:hypothetical protein